MEVRVYEPVQEGYTYVQGADPAEGLAQGDDSCAQVLCVDTGAQVAELAGKIDPFALGEQCYTLGSYYNNALTAIENNKDGGANRVLFELGYPNIYFEMKETGLPYQKPTAKLGFNVNARTRPQLVALARNYLEDGSVKLRSKLLVGQMETFALEGNKFQAIHNAHDDVVLAFLIACEMFRVALLRSAVAGNALNPIWNGEEVLPGGNEDIDRLLDTDNRTVSEKIISKHTRIHQDTVTASTVGNLAGF